MPARPYAARLQWIDRHPDPRRGKARGDRRVRSRLLRFAGPIVALAVFSLALSVLHRELAGHRIRDVMRQAAGVSVQQVLLAVALTAASFIILTQYDRLAVRYVRQALPFRRIALASFLNYAFSQGLGFPLLTGGSVRYRLYSQWGLSAVQITNVVAFASLTFWLGVLTMAGIVFLLLPEGVTRVLPLATWAVAPLGLVAVAIVGAYLWWTMRGRRVVRVRGWGFRRPALRLGLSQLAMTVADWTVASAVLYVLMPPDIGLGFPAFVGVFLLAFVAGIVSNVPAGLGVFETVVILMLPAGASESAVLGSLLVYRGVYFVLPLLAAATALGVHEVLGRRAGLSRLAGAVGRYAPALAPNILAFTSFVGGAILLFSSATPTARGGMLWLSDLLSPSLIALSHFLVSIFGAGLLLLAAGVQRRLRTAWTASLLLLVAGILASLVKGIELQETLALFAVLIALAPSRRHFHRRVSPLVEPFTPGWIGAVALVLVASVWLGALSHRYVDVPPENWWLLGDPFAVPRHLRGALGAAMVALLYWLTRLTRERPQRPTLPDAARLGIAERIVQASGEPMAGLALAGDKPLMFSDSGRALLMYAVARRSWVSLGDPVGPAGERAELAWKFHDLADHHGGWTVFYLARSEALPLYVDLGLTVTHVADMARVPLAGFTVQSDSGDPVRHSHERMARAGCTFEVLPPGAVGQVMQELNPVAEGWRRATGHYARGFSAGPFEETYLRRFPLAVVRQHGRLIAFANVWQGPDRSELSLDLLRHIPDLSPAMLDFLFVELCSWGRRSGFTWCSLGLAPLAGLEDDALRPLWSRAGPLVFRPGGHLFDLQGIRRYKERFAPVWEPLHIAAPGGLGLRSVMNDIATLVAYGHSID